MSKQLNTNDSYTVGLISDTHGLLRPEAIVAFQGVNLIIHAGDIGHPDVLSELNKIAPVKAVRGNMDAGDWAFKLPVSDMIEIGNVFIYVLHDIYKLDVDPESIGVQAVISGHTHRYSHENKNGVHFINPGTAGPFKPPISIAKLIINDTFIHPHPIEITI